VAYLLRPPHPEPAFLDVDTLVGRHPAATLRMTDAWVSTQHASIRWTNQGWQLRDLSSRNGTWLNGHRIEAGPWVPLSRGAELAFGRLDNRFVLADASPPAPAAWANGVLSTASDGLLTLPGTPDDTLIYLSDADDPESWVADGPDGPLPVRHGGLFTADRATWRLHLPRPIAATRELSIDRLAEARLTFHVSLDEETIRLQLRIGDRDLALDHQAHHEALLVLADARLEDATAGLPASEQGWRYADDVVRALNSRRSTLNTFIFRARTAMRVLGFEDADDIVERRRSSGQLRLGVAAVEVLRER
jgi:hypothetical protein